MTRRGEWAARLLMMVLAIWGAGAVEANETPPREGLVLWLDASDASTLQRDAGGAVETWTSKAGPHQALTAGNPGERPKVIDKAIHGMPAVRFDGKQLLMTSAFAHDAIGAATVFVVYQRSDDQKSDQQWQRLVSTRYEPKSLDTASPNLNLLAEANGQPVTTPPTLAHREFGGVRLGKVAVGASFDGGNWLHGDIAEVLIYDRAFLSEGEQRIVLDYLHQKWDAKVTESGWTRVGDLGPVPKRTRDDLPLSDQANKGGWTLDPEFTDEFNASTIDIKRWHLNNGGPGDWLGREPALFVPQNVSQAGGMLKLDFRKGDVPEMAKHKGYAGYTSCLIRTNARTGYGYYETRCKPMNSAASSSFWFTDTGLEDNGTEVDVFELGAKGKGFERKLNMNAHVWKTPEGPHHFTAGGVWDAPWNLGDTFHVYGFEWNKDELAWYVDGVVVRRAKNTNWYWPMYVMYDSEAMWSWFGKVDDKDLPSTFEIDYMRVWRHS